jgi:DNA repair protein RadC
MEISKSKFRGHEPITAPQTVSKLFEAILNTENSIDQDKEHFWVIGLNNRHSIKYIELVSLGTLSATLVHPREVYRMAIAQGVQSIILVHNHPSGNAEPSDEDYKITRRLQDAGKIIGIEVLDHVIIGYDKEERPLSFTSLKERGIL